MEPFRAMINAFHAEHDPAFWIVLNDSYFARNVGEGME
jgi:hypothetical protein